jgi:hypothetical protein
MVRLIVELGADPQSYISNDTDYRRVVFYTKIQIKKEIYQCNDNEVLRDLLKTQLCELQRIKEFIDNLTPECSWKDPDDVRTYINSL